MNTDTARISRFTLRFTDAALETAFAAEQARKSLRPIRFALVCAGALCVVIWPASIQVAPHMREHMPGIVAMVVATCGLCYGFTLEAESNQYTEHASHMKGIKYW